MDVDIKLLPHQYECFEALEQHRNVLLVGGRGCGKTSLGCIWTLMNALDKKQTILIGTPVYKTLKDTVIPKLKEVMRSEEFLNLNWDARVESFNKSDMKLELTNGSVIYMRSAGSQRKADRIRGLELDKVWLDEIALFSEYAFEVIQGALRGSQHTNLLGTTTPRGKNWLYDTFIDNDSDNYKAITNIRSGDNKHLPDSYVEDMKEKYSDNFRRQEVMGEFVTFEGLIYTEFDDEKHIVSDLEQFDYDKVFWGYDSGYNDPRVFLKIQKDDDKFVVTDEWYREKWLVSSALDEMVSEVDSEIYCDPSAKGDIEEMKDRNLDARSADNDVNPGIQLVKSLFKNNKLYIHERCRNLINELHSYQWDDEKDKPIKEKDHASDAMRYALYTKHRKGGGEVGVTQLDGTSFKKGSRDKTKREKLLERYGLDSGSDF